MDLCSVVLCSDLERLAGQLGLGARLRFLGLRNDVPQLLAGVDVLALTSRWEGLPNVVLEAMATGAVAVATDVGGCREVIVADETGVLIEPGRPELAAAALGRVLDDQERARAMAARARQRVEAEFSVESMAARTADAYLDLLGARARTAP
jgi:glycosyltransferase involved in cell wall biosynthesis